MPRRATPDPTAKAVGQRIRELRNERGLTAERLAFESDLTSKGYLSDIEAGRASPSLRTLQTIADYLEVLLVDLFTFPERSEREMLIDCTRWLTAGATRKLLREMPRGPARRPTAGPATGSASGPVKAAPYPLPPGPGKKHVVAEKPPRSRPVRRRPRKPPPSS